MSASFDLRSRHFESRIANLGFDVTLPHDWVSHELPQDDADFSNTTHLIALAAVMAPHSMIVFTVAARPAYEDGTLSDWSRFLLEQHGLEPRSFGEHHLGPLPALIGEAVQDSDLGPMHVRFLFAEDGQRLINVTLLAPQVLADVVAPVWFAALDSFALTDPRGPTVALWPPIEVSGIQAAKDGTLPDDHARPKSQETPVPAAVPAQAESRAADGPAWWQEALAQERADHLDAAEQAIRDAVPHIGMRSPWRACIANA